MFGSFNSSQKYVIIRQKRAINAYKFREKKKRMNASTFTGYEDFGSEDGMRRFYNDLPS